LGGGWRDHHRSWPKSAEFADAILSAAVDRTGSRACVLEGVAAASARARRVLWDRLTAHRGGRARQYLAGWPKLHQEYLPAYAPDLNPIEYFWIWLKRSDSLANSCPQTVDEITSMVCRGVESAPTNQPIFIAWMHTSHQTTSQTPPASKTLSSTTAQF
jgi:hypothetical protein